MTTLKKQRQLEKVAQELSATQAGLRLRLSRAREVIEAADRARAHRRQRRLRHAARLRMPAGESQPIHLGPR